VRGDADDNRGFRCHGVARSIGATAFGEPGAEHRDTNVHA
jgi:hypothetical protein